MKLVTYVIAPAYNAIELVLMAFPSMDEAALHLESLGLLRSEDNANTFDRVRITEGDTIRIMTLGQALDDRNEGDDEVTVAAKQLRQALFAKGHYYSGCGSCYELNLVNAAIGQPVVAFDLD